MYNCPRCGVGTTESNMSICESCKVQTKLFSDMRLRVMELTNGGHDREGKVLKVSQEEFDSLVNYNKGIVNDFTIGEEEPRFMGLKVEVVG